MSNSFKSIKFLPQSVKFTLSTPTIGIGVLGVGVPLACEAENSATDDRRFSVRSVLKRAIAPEASSIMRVLFLAFSIKVSVSVFV